MELSELKFLAAASLLSGSVKQRAYESHQVAIPADYEIEAAVLTAQRIWDEVLKQDKES